MEDLVQIFGDDDHPICVNFVGSKYPGIITPQDIVYSEFNKTHMLSLFVNLETSIRNFLLHLLANEDLSSSNVNYFMRDGDPIWKASIAYVYGRLASKSLDNILPFENTEFYRIMQLRNTMTHNDILTNVDDQVDSKKTGGYLKFLQHDANKIQQFTKDHQIDIKYREFITIFSREFSEFSMIEEKLLGKITTSDFNKCLSQLTHNQNAFNLYFDNPKVVFKTQQVQKLLENRNLPWKSKIIHWPSNKSGQEIQIEINQELAKAEAEAVRRQDEIKSKLPTFFRETIHQILLLKCDEHNQIEQSTLKAEFRSLIVNARDDFR